jgi:predicted nucleotidyltransferase
MSILYRVVRWRVAVARIPLDQSKIAEFCRERHIQRLSLFGSVLRDDFGPDSDVDVLVEFEPGHVPGLAFFSIESELSELLGRRVDLNTPGFLSPHFRSQVLAEAEVQYAQPA